MIPFVSHPDYVAPLPAGHSFPMSKYACLLPALIEAGAVLDPHAPTEMPRDWLLRVHDAAYVDQVLAALVDPAIERRIGFPVTPAVVRRSRLTAGGTWAAARLALAHGYAANGAGGSHHALPGTGAGYCVLNDLAVAAARLLAEGDARRIAIVDLDVHQGDGTATIFAGSTQVFTFSVHADKNFPARKAASHRDVALPDGTGDAAYLAVLGVELPRLFDGFGPDLVLYQAGVDCHADDKLGRLALSDAGLEARDRLVMAEAARRGIALASVVGGGYGADRMAVARRHAATIIALADEARRWRGVSAAAPV